MASSHVAVSHFRLLQEREISSKYCSFLFGFIFGQTEAIPGLNGFGSVLSRLFLFGFFSTPMAFFNAIAKDFEIGAFGASLVFTCVHGVGAICAPLVGRALDRYPVRLVMAIGALSMGGILTVAGE